MNNSIGFYDLDVVWVSEGVGEWRVKCHRCGLSQQTSREGPTYKSSPDLVMLINTHICDPRNRALDIN